MSHKNLGGISRRRNYMKIGTKALVTLFAVTVPAVGNAFTGSRSVKTSRAEKKLERLHRHHDRKMELRAGVLGISPDALRHDLKTKTFDQILREHGFSSRRNYHMAVLGKLKEELQRRGWDDQKIQHFVKKRFERQHDKTAVAM
jgi:hypothetical protein